MRARVFWTALFLCFTLAGNAQLKPEFGGSLSIGATGYAPSFRLFQLGPSPQLGFFVDLPVQAWVRFRLGAAFTLTQQRRPHFSHNFAYLGLPFSVLIPAKPIGKKAIVRPLFMTRIHPAWLLSGDQYYGSTQPTALVASNRLAWGAGIGVELKAAKRTYEILLTASLASSLNDNYEDGGTIEPLLGTRVALEWNFKL
ncbi:MAG: hypothetical protein AAF927_23770 [Bacteroidota bacterium]